MSTESLVRINNPTKRSDQTFFELPPNAVLHDGTYPDANSGGLLELYYAEGQTQYYSVARPYKVAGGEEAAADGRIISQRVGRMTIAVAAHSAQKKMGGEQEFVIVDEYTGEYSPALGLANEALLTEGEDNTVPVVSSEDLEAQYFDLARRNVGRAVAKGVLVVPVSVHGQRNATESEINPSKYVLHTKAEMESITGFAWTDVLRMMGTQFHTEISDLRAALQAAEAMQLLNPILSAPSMAGPFLEGDTLLKLHLVNQYSERQRAHLDNVYLTDDGTRDLGSNTGESLRIDAYINDGLKFLSWRYPIRRVVSPGAGIWKEPAPESVEAYLEEVHNGLAQGSYATADRFRGPHADRIRTVLDGSGATTFESCAYDTFAGNQQLITDHHLLHSAIFTTLEKLAMDGTDVVEIVSRMLSISQLSREKRLKVAHEQMMSTSHRATDAMVYSTGNMQRFLDILIRPLIKDATQFDLSDDRWARIMRSYTDGFSTLSKIDEWCRAHNTKPSIRAYYALGIGAPAYYMKAQEWSLPNSMSQTEKVRFIEHDMGLAFREQYR